MHVSRSVTGGDQGAYREFMTHFDNSVKVAEGEELSSEKRQDVIRDLITRVTEGQGSLDGAKENGMSLGWHHGESLMIRCRVDTFTYTTFAGREL
jgi:hypothetical protein